MSQRPGDGSSCIAYPRPDVNDEFGNRMQCVGEDEVSEVHVRNYEGMVFTNDTVRALVAVA